MLIIFGWGRVGEKHFGTASVMKCNGCLKMSEWELVEVNKNITLFFVPVAAYERKFFLVCKNCLKQTQQIYGDDVKSAKEKVKLYRAFRNGKITEDQLSDSLKKLYTKYIGEIEDNWECPECHTENPNSLYSCEKCGYKVI